MAPSMRHLFIFVTLCTSSFAVPAFGTSSGEAPILSQSQQTNVRHGQIPDSPFRRLRDSIIQTIWSVPEKSGTKSTYLDLTSTPKPYRTRYAGDVVLRFKISTDEEAKEFSEAAKILYLDIWDSTDDWVDVRITKNVLPSFLSLLPPSLHNVHSPVMHDLAQAVYDTYPNTLASESWRKHSVFKDSPHDVFFQEYQPLSVLYPWLRFMNSLFPDHTEVITIGKSYEGRDIMGIRVGIEPPDDDPHKGERRHTIVITGGSHAREWISVSTTTYIAYSFATRFDDPQSPYIKKILEHYDLVFIPVLNPDGYEYTWSTDRLWRKNRQNTTLPFCPGIDLDRAFPMGWDGDLDRDNPCMESYAGTHPLEAIEAQRLVEWASNETQFNNKLFKSFLDLHSYSQQVLYPYSFTCLKDPPNLEDLEEVASGLAKSFRITAGHRYGVSSACRGSITLNIQTDENDNKQTVRTKTEATGGSALDWFYQDLGVKWAYQIKLRDTGSYGFLLPKDNIVPSGREAFEAVLGLGKWLLGNRGIERFETDGIWGHEAPFEEDVRDNHEDDEDDGNWWELRRRLKR